MSLEFHQLSPQIEQMALHAAGQVRLRQSLMSEAVERLHTFATNWSRIEAGLATAAERADEKYYRSAKPLNRQTPLDAAIDPPAIPERATIVATDGSQILPDRHAPFAYYLVNVGGIIYGHGSGEPPSVFSEPRIEYLADAFDTSSGEVNVQRDLAEIGYLADTAVAEREANGPVLAILDQRLLYWPIGGQGADGDKAVRDWLKQMSVMRRAGVWLVGYIDRPEKSSVYNLLQSTVAEEGFDWKSLGKRGPGVIADRIIFGDVLRPGQRSAVFVDVSSRNEDFTADDPAHEVCFFYLHPGGAGRNIARVDLPRWVAEDDTAIATIHALLVDQCAIIGGYPYVLARADEMAVVGRQDTAELNFMIEVVMQRRGITADITAKLDSKSVARGGRTAHTL